jgi:hypothetical protein
MSTKRHNCISVIFEHHWKIFWKVNVKRKKKEYKLGYTGCPTECAIFKPVIDPQVKVLQKKFKCSKLNRVGTRAI